MLRLLRRNTTEKSDDELVQLYQKSGDLEVLGVLYERYVELVYGVCLKFFKEKTRAEDAVMVIFEVLVEKVRTQEIRQFRPWLHVVAKNHCLMQLRKKDRTVSFDEMLPAAQAEVVLAPHRARDHSAAWLLHAAHCHAQVLCLDHNGHAIRL